MKKVLTYLVTSMMAASVFYGGAGINMISYCCNVCRSVGIDAVTNGKCCDIHHHDHSGRYIAHHASVCCENTCDKHVENHPVVAVLTGCNHHSEFESTDCCNMKRISFDLFAQSLLKQEINLSPLLTDLFSGDILTVSHLDNISIGEKLTHAPHGPPTVLPRDYLSILTVLLI